MDRYTYYAYSPLPNPLPYTQKVACGFIIRPEQHDRTCVAPDPSEFILPRVSGYFPKSLIIQRGCGTPEICAAAPQAVYTYVRSSTSYERMAMFAIGLSIAREMNVLFYCTQLQSICPDLKATITSPAVGWESTLGDIRAFVGSYGEDDYVPTADEMYSMFPIEPIVEMAVAAIGERIRAESLFVPMIRENHSNRLTFSLLPEAARQSPVNRGETTMVPVVYVEPLKIATYPCAEPHNGPFEAHLFVIAGDVLVVPYSSDIMTISCAHNAAFVQASKHGVHHIRTVVSWDMSTGYIGAQVYNQF